MRDKTPHRSEINGTAQRAVPRVKEGTSSVLVQSGLEDSCWAEAMEWSVVAISEMCKTYWQMARHLMNDGSVHHFKGRLFSLEQEQNSSVNL